MTEIDAVENPTHYGGASAFDFAGLKAHRRAQVRALLDSHKLDALVISRNDCFQFFANAEIGSYYWERPFALIVMRDRDPIAIVNAASEHGMNMQAEKSNSWIGDVVSYLETPVETIANTYATVDFPNLLADRLSDLGLADACIGVDTMTAHVREVQSLLPEIIIEDIAIALFDLRNVKHPVEIDLIRGAAVLGDHAMTALVERLEVGANLQVLSAASIMDVLSEAARLFPGGNAQVPKMLTLCGAAGASTDGDGAPNGQVVVAGQPVVSVVVVRLNGYSIEVHRTYILGKADPEDVRLMTAAIEINKAALDQVFAGNPLYRIDEAVRHAASDHGFQQYLTHRAGHGIGVTTHEWPSDVPVNERPIRLNETFSCEPGLYIRDKGGFRFGDLVVAGETPEIVTAAPKRLEDCLLN